MLPPNRGVRISLFSQVNRYIIPGKSGYTIPGNIGNDVPAISLTGKRTAPARVARAADRITVVLTVDQANILSTEVPANGWRQLCEKIYMLPVRAVVNTWRYYGWDPAQQKATAFLGDKTVSVWVGRAMAEAGGRKLQIDPDNPRVMPVIVPPGRTLLPLRFIAENLGCSVEWEPTARTITILYPGAA